MPKMKTKKAAAKRFSFTATGKVKFKRAGLRHGMSNKGRDRKRELRPTGYLIPGDARHAENCLPYGN